MLKYDGVCQLIFPFPPSPEAGEVVLIGGHIGESHGDGDEEDLLPRHQVRDCPELGAWARRNFGKHLASIASIATVVAVRPSQHRKCCFYQFSAFTRKHSAAF